MITVDRQAIYTLADILQANTFPTFTLIAPVWVQALHDQYCTVSSESFSDHCGTNLLQHVRKLLEVHNDCVHCESLPTISNVISYHSSRTQCLIIRPSRVFVVSVRHEFDNSAASQCRSLTELRGLYYHMCYVSFTESLPRRYLNIYAQPPQGTSFCLGTVHIDRV